MIRINAEVTIPDIEKRLRESSKEVMKKFSEVVYSTMNELKAIAVAKIKAERPGSVNLTNVDVKADVDGDKVIGRLVFPDLTYTLTQLRLWDSQGRVATLHNVYIPLTTRLKSSHVTPKQFVQEGGGGKIRSRRGSELLVKWQKGPSVRPTLFQKESASVHRSSGNTFVPMFLRKDEIRIERVDLTLLTDIYDLVYSTILRQAMADLIAENF